MPEQFNDITSFRAYQKQIYEYLNNRMVQVPLFFENQNAVNNTTLPSATSQIGGNFQQTIRDGKVVKGKRINEIFTSFDNVYSNNQDDLSIIEYIAYKLNGLTPHEAIIDVDAFIYEGSNVNGLLGPISTIGGLPENTAASYIYIPYVDLKNVNEKLLLNYNSGLDTLQDYFNTLDVPGANFEDFKTQLIAKKINLSARKYNLSDNTSNFLPVGVQKRRVSKKVLQDNSETTISEILPETDAYLIQQFFQQWDKVKPKIESGQEYIEGSTFLNSGNFAGGIGPGNYNLWLNTTTDGTPINNITPPPSDYQFFQNNSDISPTSLWDQQNQSSAIASQRVIEKENPGLSSFVYSTQRNAPVWYTIDVLDTLSNFKPGVSYTLSGWQTQDDEFNQGNYAELGPGHFFFFQLDAVMGDDTLVPVIEFPAFDSEPSSFLPLIKGEAIEVWQGSTQIWTRYKKTFTIPVNESNEAVDAQNNALDATWSGNYKLTWFMGYQNSIELPSSQAQIYNGALLGGGISGENTESNIWDGPTIRSNTNFASQYYTGLRLNVGEQVTGITKLPLEQIQSQTIARILQDCVTLLEPDFPQRNIPIYSDAKLQELILSQKNTALITTTLVEIKQGLIVALKTLVDGISETYSGVAQSLIGNNEGDNTLVLQELVSNLETMIQQTGVRDALENLENAIQNAFSAVTTNFTGVVNEASLNAYYQYLPGITEVNAPGFKRWTTSEGNEVLGVHFGLGILELENGGNAIPPLLANRYLTNEGITQFNSYSATGDYLHPYGDATPGANPIPDDFVDTIPLFLNTGQDDNGSESQTYIYGGKHDLFTNGTQGNNLRNMIVDLQTPFIQVDMLRYRVPLAEVGDFGSDSNELFSEQYIKPATTMQSGQAHGGGNYPNVGKQYDGFYVNDVIKKYLYQNAATPIGAFYTSEMMNSGYNNAAREGNPTTYLYNPNNYPSTGYGPYSANNLPDNYLIQDFGFTNGVDRTKDIYNTYMTRYSQGDALYVDANENKQFLGLQNTFSNRNQLYDAVEASEYFEELETYTLDFYSGIEFMGFVYTRLFENNWINGFGYQNIDTGASKQAILSKGILPTEKPWYWETPLYAREDFFHFVDPAAHADANYRGGKITMRFYEPHWEWNPQQLQWVFRLSQPVIGSEYGPAIQVPDGIQTVTNEDIELGMESYKFEKKFKFKKMEYFTKEG